MSYVLGADVPARPPDIDTGSGPEIVKTPTTSGTALLIGVAAALVGVGLFIIKGKK